MKYDINYCETNLNLETNKEIMSQWKYFNCINHKTRRAFILNIMEDNYGTKN